MIDLDSNTLVQIIDVAAVKVIDILSASPEQDEVIVCGNLVNVEDLSCSSSGKFEGDLIADTQEKSSVYEISRTTEATLLWSPEDILPLKLPVDAEDGGTHNEARSTPIESKSVSKEENPILNKLLRQWRYFDSEDVAFHLEGRTVSSAAQKRRKPCYVCGDVQHNGKRCRKRRTCYTCNGKGHIAEDCPKNDQKYDYCLRCGEPGHDLFSCIGHLCCGDYFDTDPTSSSCCNCGESGHSGFECPKPPLDKGQPPSICYKCGDQDHVGRYCTVTNTGVPRQKCIRNPQGELLDPNKSDLAQDESRIADPVTEMDDASRRRHQRKARKYKAFRHRRVKKYKKTDSVAE